MSSQQKPNANKSNKPSQKSGSANPPKESANVQKKEPKNTGGGCCGRPHKSAPRHPGPAADVRELKMTHVPTTANRSRILSPKNRIDVLGERIIGDLVAMKKV